MKNRLFVPSALAACAFVALASPLFAQQEAREPRLEVLTLRYTNAEAVKVLLESMMPEGIISLSELGQTNQLVVQGEPDALNKLKALVEQLDVERVREGRSTELIPVGSYPIEEAARLVVKRLGGDEVRVGIDKLNKRLVVTGSRDELKSVSSMLKQLDRPSSSLTITLFFIRGMIGSGAGPASDVPAALQPIVKTLGENGFSQMSLLAPVMIRTNDARRFTSTSTLIGKRADESTGSDGKPAAGAEKSVKPADGPKPGQLSFKAIGQADLSSASQEVSLELSSALEGIVQQQRVSFGIETTLVVKLNQYVLLAASPSSTEGGDAVALVVRVTKEE